MSASLTPGPGKTYMMQKTALARWPAGARWEKTRIIYNSHVTITKARWRRTSTS